MNHLHTITRSPLKTVEQLLHPYSPPETTLVERMRYWNSAQPDRCAYVFLADGENVEESITYAQLDERVRAVAARLISMGLRGQRALLMYPSGIEFVVAFFACQYAGVTAVPAYPPRRNRNMGRINSISDDASTVVAMTTREIFDRRSSMNIECGSLDTQVWLATEETPIEMSGDWVNPGVTADDLAIIQYTSGSTGSPKGVMLRQSNVIANCRYITEGFQINNDAVGSCWLPVYHDMGLIGGLVVSAFCGTTSVLMSPVHFLAKPVRWLKSISDFNVSIAGGPNFAYDLCCDKISAEDCAGLDLSSWKVAFNGAEPIRADVLERFTRKFEPYGFRHENHYPCYGMAETTLIVTGGNPAEEPVIRSFDAEELSRHRVVPVADSAAGAKRLVGCGKPIMDEQVVIVHPETCRQLEEGQIGEIWVRGGSVGQGYWQKPEATESVFRATLQNAVDEPFLRTGDLGFFHDGELFVAGRLKDMIIIRGVNRYPQDIEETTEHANPRLRVRGSAAFAVDHWDRERLVVVSEVERGPGADWDEIIQQIRSDITAEHDLPPDEVVLVRANSVPKTSSGKVQRHACRQQYLDKKLLVVAKWSADSCPEPAIAQSAETPQAAPDTNPELLEIVLQAVRQVARERARNLSPETNIVVDLGLDSLERLQIANALEQQFAGRFPDDVLQEIETVGEVTAAVEKYLGNQAVSPPVPEAPVPRSQPKYRGDIPESYYKIEKMPEYIRFNRLRSLMKSSGIRNPYFSVHEGKITDTTIVDGRSLISFSSYNYISMSGDPAVSRAAIEAIEKYGTSTSASRLVSGEKSIHKTLEKELAEFLGCEDVITFAGGHATNESVIGHIVKPGDLIIHDSLAHNSIIQGAELSGARRRPFAHNDWRALDKILAEIRNDYHCVLIAIEGLYSMDGDYPELDKFVEVKNRHRAMLYVDEAHSLGTLGATGRGAGEMFKVDRGDVELWMGTLSKSFGSAGGFIAGSHALVEYLRYTTPGFVFAAGLPPAQVGAASGALRALQEQPERVEKLREISALFLKLAKQAGLNTGPSNNSPIIPVITGNSMLALRLSEAMYHQGINVQPILHPAVDEDLTRLRFFLTSSHTVEQVKYTVDVLQREWEKISGKA